MTGHGVALVILTDMTADPEAWGLDLTIDGTFGPKLRAQCECGWHASFPEVVTFDLLDQAVNEHRAEIIAEIKPTCRICNDWIEPCGGNARCVHVGSRLCVKHLRPAETAGAS